MKNLLGTLLLAAVVLCEVPPPYPPRGFRPNPAFNLPVRQPQTTYGVPNASPSKILHISPQTTYGVPNASPSKILQISPQRQYGVPNQPNTPNLTPNFNSKQTVPCTSHNVPTTFGNSAAIAPSFNSKQAIPSISYGVPVTVSPYRTIVSESQIANQHGLRHTTPSLLTNFNSKQTIPSASYGTPVTSSPYRTINEPQIIYGAPNQISPNGQYDVPDVKNIETLEQIKQLNSLLQLSQSNSNQQKQIDINLLQSQNSNRNVGIPSQQYLPIKEASSFRSDMNSPNSQRGNQQPALEYLPVKEPTNFRNGFDLSQSNVQESFNGQPNPNLQQPSQQYLPVREPLHVKKVLPEINVVNTPNNGLSGQNIQPNVNIPHLVNNPEVLKGAGSFQTQLPQQNKNPNVASLNRNQNVNNYNVPPQNGIEIERLNVRPLPSSNNVPISIRQNVARPIQNGQQNIELEGSNIQGEKRGQVNQRYLPPSTVRPGLGPTSTPAPLPKDSSGEEFPEPQGEAGGPNVSVATAVSGIPNGQSFYLLQPDGRLQKVIYEKTRIEGDRENEYTANYLFQNIQAEPGLVYSPLVSLGKR